jgi:hypothetical protein
MALLGSCVALPSYAQNTRCAPRSEALQTLNNFYGETRIGAGVAAGQRHIVELFVNEETGAWSIVLSGLDGQTCFLVDGEAWEEIVEALPPNG